MLRTTHAKFAVVYLHSPYTLAKFRAELAFLNITKLRTIMYQNSNGESLTKICGVTFGSPILSSVEVAFRQNTR